MMNEIDDEIELIESYFSFESESELREGHLLFKSNDFACVTETHAKLFYKIGRRSGHYAKCEITKHHTSLSNFICNCSLSKNSNRQVCRHQVCLMCIWASIRNLEKFRKELLASYRTKPSSFVFTSSMILNNAMANLGDFFDVSTKKIDAPWYVEGYRVNESAGISLFEFSVQMLPVSSEQFRVTIERDNDSFKMGCSCSTPIEGKYCVHSLHVFTHLFTNPSMGANFLLQVPGSDKEAESIIKNAPERGASEMLAFRQKHKVVVDGVEYELEANPVYAFHGSQEEDWFDLKIEIRWGQNKEIGMMDIIKAVRSNVPYVMLSSGKFGLIPDDLIQKVRNLMTVSEIKDGKVRLKTFNLATFEELDLKNSFVDGVLEKLKQIQDHSLVSSYQVPRSINAKLRDYQVMGFQRMMYYYDLGWGMCLNDDMGLGKTLQAITTMAAIKSHKKGDHKINLIICPANVLYNWNTELENFAPEMNKVVYHGDKRELSSKVLAKADIVITTFGIVSRDIDALTKITWGIIVVDEAHKIKNKDGDYYKSIIQLDAKVRYALSGTLIQNSSRELFAVFNFLNRGMLGDYKSFMKVAAEVDRGSNPVAAQMLARKIRFFNLRRTKEQVATDLPDKIQQIQFCEMEGQQKEVYDMLLELFRRRVKDEIVANGIKNLVKGILPMVQKLIQTCDSPKLLNFKAIGTHFEKWSSLQESCKIVGLMNKIDEIFAIPNTDGHPNKILVFSQFTSYLNIIEEELTKRSLKSYRIDGDVKPLERDRLQKAFNDPSDDHCIFLISITAGNVGLNLQGANYVIITEPHWNPSIEDQAMDRSYRIGQKRTVFVTRLICPGTIEEKMLRVHEKKRSIAKSIESPAFNSGQMSGALTLEDIKFIFS